MQSLPDRFFEWLQQDEKKRPFVSPPWDEISQEELRALPFRFRFKTRLQIYIVWIAGIFFALGVFSSNRFFLGFSVGLVGLLLYCFYQARSTLSSLTIGRFEYPGTTFEHENFSIRLYLTNSGEVVTSPALIRLCFQGAQKYDAYANSITIPPGESRPVSFEFKADRGMGKFNLGPVHLMMFDSLGLFTLCVRINTTETINILPEEIALESFEVHSAALALHSGSFEVKAPGDAPSFLGLREWRPGDKTRRIDWRRSQALDKLIVREFERLNAAEATIFLDQHSGAHCDFRHFSTMEILKDSAISLVKCLVQQQLSVQFISAETQIPFDRGTEHAQICLEEIQKLKPLPQAPLCDLLDKYLVTAPTDSIVILLMTSVQGDFRTLIEYFILFNERRIDTILVVVDVQAFISMIEKEVELDWINQNILRTLKDYVLETVKDGSVGATLAERTFVLGPGKNLADVYYA